jgi:hypothetical protein
MTEGKGHVWAVDEDGVCEYDMGYVCACGARQTVMAEGDTKLGWLAARDCRLALWPACGCGQGLTFGDMCPECFTKGRVPDTN